MMRPLTAFALFGVLVAANALTAPHAEGGYVASLMRDGPTEPSAPLLKMADDDPNALTQLFISPCGEPFRAKASDPYPVVVWFNRADTDHDGQLDRAEFIADAMQFFQKLDANGDGVIDSRELYYYEHITVPEIMAGQQQTSALTPRFIRVAEFELVQAGGMGGMGGAAGGGLGGMNGPPVVNGNDEPPPSHPDTSDPNRLVGAAPYNLLGEPEPVAASDLSFAGKISQADFKTRASQRFDVLDSDQRGYLTLNSLPKTFAETLVKPRRQGKRRAGPPQS
jgi:Ca2+-binding EF-hand superfamily protein